MKKPKLLLKKIKLFEGMEGQGINADLYIDGVKYYFVIDSGDGGEMEFRNVHATTPEQQESIKANIQLLQDYVQHAPQHTWVYDGRTYSLPESLSNMVYEAMKEQEHEKFINKLNKLFLTAIVVGVPNGDKYSYRNFKLPLSNIPKSILQSEVNILFMECKGKEVILNTNLKDLGIVIN